jgi:Tfp pilus assembly protein PilZ
LAQNYVLTVVSAATSVEELFKMHYEKVSATIDLLKYQNNQVYFVQHQKAAKLGDKVFLVTNLQCDRVM